MNKLINGLLVIATSSVRSFIPSCHFENARNSVLNQSEENTASFPDNIPLVGRDLKDLEGNDKQAVEDLLNDISSPLFMAFCNSPFKDFDIQNIDNIIVGCENMFDESASMNCYNLSTNTTHNGEFGLKFPGSTLPDLTSNNHKDNCDEFEKGLFEEHGNDVRIIGKNDECNNDEISFTSYVSNKIVNGYDSDYHCTMVTKEGDIFEKRGALPAVKVDKNEYNSGILKSKHTLWIQTVSEKNIGHGVGKIDNIGEVKAIYPETSLQYDECDTYCLRVKNFAIEDLSR